MSKNDSDLDQFGLMEIPQVGIWLRYCKVCGSLIADTNAHRSGCFER
jgi:hypothetical protein